MEGYEREEGSLRKSKWCLGHLRTRNGQRREKCSTFCQWSCCPQQRKSIWALLIYRKLIPLERRSGVRSTRVCNGRLRRASLLFRSRTRLLWKGTAVVQIRLFFHFGLVLFSYSFFFGPRRQRSRSLLWIVYMGKKSRQINVTWRMKDWASKRGRKSREKNRIARRKVLSSRFASAPPHPSAWQMVRFISRYCFA